MKIESLGYKKIHEEIGKATYILYEVKYIEHKARKIEVKRVDLNVESLKSARISAYKAETACPYGSKKCSAALYSNELNAFRRKLRLMMLRWWVKNVVFGLFRRRK